MLLCQVALGNSQEISSDGTNLNEPLDFNQFQSRKAHGRQIPDPRHTITRNYGLFLLKCSSISFQREILLGVQMPLGQLINCNDSKHLHHRYTHNEYLVFDQSQIAIRYLVQFRK